MVVFGKMKPAYRISILAAAVLALGTAWSGSDRPAAPVAALPEAAPAREAAPAGEGALPEARSAAPSALLSREHAPLALFSLGSLAVGGIFYGIDIASRRPNVEHTSGGRAGLNSALGAAGLTALLAAGSYFYFARKAAFRDREWNAEVTGGPTADGDMAVGAVLTLPLPSFAP